MRQPEHPRLNSIKACRSVTTVVGHVRFQLISKALQSDASAHCSISAACIPLKIEPECYWDLLLHCVFSKQSILNAFQLHSRIKSFTSNFCYSNIASKWTNYLRQQPRIICCCTDCIWRKNRSKYNQKMIRKSFYLRVISRIQTVQVSLQCWYCQLGTLRWKTTVKLPNIKNIFIPNR